MKLTARSYWMLMPLLTGMAIAATIAVFHPGPATGTGVIMRFGHAALADSPQAKAARRFSELVHRYTQGRVKVELVPDASPLKDRDGLGALQLGSVQMLAPSLSRLRLLGVRDFDLFELPFVFPDRDAVQRVIDGPIGRTLLDRLKWHGIVGVGYWDGGFKHLLADRPLTRVEDFRGLSVGIAASKVAQMQFRALQALPQTLNASDTGRALRSGALNGVEDTAAGIEARGWHAIRHHLTLSSHRYEAHAVIVNKRFWDKLPREHRVEIERAMRDASVYARQLTQAEEETALARMRATGSVQLHQLDAAQQAAWRNALAPVYRRFEAGLTPGLLSDARASGEHQESAKDYSSAAERNSFALRQSR